MIITVTAPKKGLGQTTTTINIAAVLSKFLTENNKSIKILIIDINKYCKDIEYYLSNSLATRGLDDYFSLFQSNLITNDSFQTCIKKINENISIIGSNEYFEITQDAMVDLLRRSKELYDFVIIDSIATTTLTDTQRTLFDKSEKIVVVLNQTKSSTQLVYTKNIYKTYDEKTMYILNKEISNDNVFGSVDYGKLEVKKELDALEVDAPLYSLVFDADIMNESNYGSILSYSLSDKSYKRNYNGQMLEIVKELLKDDPKYQDIIILGRSEKKGLFGFKK